VGKIRLSIHKDFWPEFRDVSECPGPVDEDTAGPDQSLWPRILGTIKKWTKKGKTLRMVWYNGEQTNTLRSMADPDFDLRLEKYADGRDPPCTRGEGARGVPVATAPELANM